MDKAMAIEAMLSDVRGLPTDAEQIVSLQRQLKSLYAAFVAMEHERDDHERTVLEFIGWLTVDISELHSVEVPRLADSYQRFVLRCNELRQAADAVGLSVGAVTDGERA